MCGEWSGDRVGGAEVEASTEDCPPFQAANGGASWGGDHKAETQARARFWRTARRTRFARGSLVLGTRGRGLSPWEGLGHLETEAFPGSFEQVSLAYFLLCFPYALFPCDPEQTRSPWELPASQASSRPFLLVQPGSPSQAISCHPLGAQALRASSLGHNLVSPLLRPIKFPRGENLTLQRWPRAHLPLQGALPCVYPGGAGPADLDLAGPAGSPHPTGPAVCQPGLVADLGRVPSPLLVSFSVNTGRLIIINVKRFPSDEIVLKIS